MDSEIIDPAGRQMPPPSLVGGRFTIAIPTYNRATFLRRSLHAALSQTQENVEVLVCDNASTDNTPDVVAEFGKRVRYHRHDTNIGAFQNFFSAPALASGEYFSWLQDDDTIHRDFVKHAIEAFDASPEVQAYSCYSANGPSASTYVYPSIYGAGVPLDWQSGQITFFRPNQIAAIAFFHNLGLPPTFACRTKSLTNVLAAIPSDCDLYVERLIPLLIACGGTYGIEPWVGGLFYKHALQNHKQLHAMGSGATDWTNMARWLGHYIESHCDDSWRVMLATNLSQVATSDRVNWLRDPYTAGINWKAVHPVAQEARELLIASLPAELFAPVESPRYGARSFVKDLVPPLAVKLVRLLRRQS